MALIGRIVAMTGVASLISDNGAKRDLHLGDSIQTGDTIQTLRGVEVDLELANGRVIHISAEQLVAFTEELTSVFVPDALDNSINLATIDTVIKAIEEGKDINEVLEETAAGLGGQSNAYGFGFVDLLRVNSDLGDSGFIFDSNAADRLDSVPAVVINDAVIVDSVVATAIATTPVTSTVSLSATASVAEGGNITYTATLTSAAQGAVTVTLDNGTIITIANGQTTGTVSVAAPTDDVYIDAGSVTAAISTAVGGSFESLVVNPAVATTSITDTTDSTSITLSSATAGSAVTEGGSITYNITLGAAVTGSPLTVTLSNGDSTVIGIGASTGTIISSVRPDNITLDGTDNLAVSISGTSGGNFELLTPSGTVNNTVVDDADSTTVTLTASTASVTEGGSIIYTASLTNPTDTAMTVTLSGGQTITIAAGTASGSVSVAAPSDDAFIDAGSVSKTITGFSGGNLENVITDSTPAVTAISDTIDSTTLSLTASGSVAEGGNIVYTASLTNPTDTAMTVTLSGGQTITIAAGTASGSVSVAAPSDDAFIDAGSVSKTITGFSGGNLENVITDSTPAVTAISDTIDSTTLSLTASGSVAEGGNIVYTASLTNPTDTAMTVTLSGGQTITIAAGTASGSVSVAAPSDDAFIDAGSVSKTITGFSGGNLENVITDSTPAVTAISDTIDSTTLSLTASGSVAEGGNIVYTASLTNPTDTAMTVTLSGGQTITIAAGTASGSVSVAAPSDDAFIDAGSVSKTITGFSGGNLENVITDSTPAVTAISDTIDSTTLSLTASGSVAEGGNIVYTASLTNPTDTAMTVTLSGGQTITIAAGTASGSVSVAAPSDDAFIDAGSVSKTITGFSGGNLENVITDSTPAVTAISDTIDSTTLSLTASGSVAEGGNIVYTASLTNPTDTAMTVTLSGGQTITIAAGTASGSVSVAAPSDDAFIDAGSVSKTITGFSGGNLENVITDSTPAVTAISDTIDSTTVSISGSASVAEGAAASYTVALTGTAQTDVTVNLTYSGIAADGSDYTGVASVVITAGSSSANFNIATIDDALAEGSENFTVSIASATGGNFEKLVVSPVNGSITSGIVDNDIATVSLSATPTLTEAGGNIVYTATMSQAPVTDLTVTLSNGSTITITAGQFTGTVSVPVTADEDVYIDPTSISATISSTSGGGISVAIDPTAATTSISDTIDSTTLSLTASGSVAEGGNIVYTASLTNPTDTAMTVTLSGGQTITIAAGTASGSVSVAAPSDDAFIDAGSVSKTITGFSGGNLENVITDSTPAVTAISDTIDSTTLSLTASGSVAEGGNIVYTASLTNPTDTAMTVTLSGGQTITIAAGTASGSVSVAAPSDDAFIDAGSVSKTITGFSGGNLENVITDSTPAVTAISDTIDSTTLSLTASGSVAEGGNIVYTASLTNPTDTAMTVTLSGGQTITIAAGTASGSVSVAAPSDDAFIDAGSVSKTITGFSGGNLENVITDSTPAVTAISDTIDSTTLSLTASGSVAEGGNIVYTASLTNPTDTAMTVTLSGGQTITIAAGTASGSVSVAAPSDDAFIDAGSVSKTITGFSGGNLENVITDSTPAVTAISDTIDSTTLSLTASGSVAEGGNIVYTASLTNPTDTAMTVTLSGGQTITIAAGTASGSVSVAAPSDDAFIDAGSVSKTITGFSGGNLENVITDSTPAVTAISDTIDSTTLSLTASGSVAEGGNIVYTASLTNPTDTAMTVTLSGGQTITIAAGTASGSVSVAAPSDDAFIDAGSVSKTITGFSGGNLENVITDSTPAVTAISDTIDSTTLSLTASGSVAEGGNIVYTASLTNPTDTAMTVTLSGGQTITIAAGTASGSVSVAAPSDDAFIDAGSVSKTITGFSGGNLENVITDSTPAVTAISDTIDSTTVSISGSASVAEGAAASYTVALTGTAQTDVTVNLTYSGIAADGSDYTGVASVVITAGSSSANFNIATIDDALAEGSENFTVSIASATGGNFEQLVVSPVNGSITSGIVDNDIATVSLSATPTLTEAGGNIVYTATMSQAPVTDLTVTLSNGSTITITAGQFTGTVSVPVTADEDVYIDPTSISATISSTSGGGISVAIDPTAATTSISDTIDSTTLSLTASGSVAEGGNIVYTASLTNPTDTAMTVTLSGGQTITIAAGTASGSVSVAAPSDDAFIDAGSVSKTITGFSGGNLENVITDSTPAVTAISDTIDSTTLSLTASGSVAEGGNIVYTASLTNPTDTAMTVTLSGGQTITIAAGTASGSVSVAAPSDDAFIDAGSVSKTITGFSGGNLENVITDSTPAVTAISDTIDSTTVSISGSASVAEGAAASYTVALTGTAQTDVTVNLTYSGIAADGSDYTGVASVVITAGSSSANFNIATIDDALAEGSENFTVSIASATGGNFEQLVVSPVNGSITSGIVDNDIATVSLSATPTLTEAGGNIVYTATMSQAPVTDLTVTLSNGSTITITAGQFTGTVSVPVTADEDVYIDPTSISATISSTSGGGISVAIDPTAATTSISDTIDSTTLSLTASGSVAEGGNIVYTASLTNPTDTAMTVTLSGGQTITIAAGTASGSVSVAAPSDDAFIDAGSVSKTITGFSGGNLENVITDSTPAVTAISDTIDSTTVSISGSASVAEGAAASYTVALTGTAQTDVTVNLTYSGIAADGSDYTGVASVVITAGSSSANFNIATIDDALAEGSENFTVSIASATGGNFEQLVVSPVNGSITSGIVDNDIATVSLSATPTLTEAGGNIVYTATMSQAPVTDLTVTLSNGSTITITAGQFTGTVSVPVTADEDVYIDPTSISATISSTSGGGISVAIDPTAATTSISDTIDSTTLSLTASGSVAEGGNIVYTASLTNPTDTAMTVTLSGGQTITIAAGTASGSVSVAAPSDDAFIDAGSVSKTITGFSGGNLENVITDSTPAVTAISDTIDSTTLSLTASGSVAEGGNIVYTASLTNPTDTAMTVTLSGGQTITIAAGTASGSVSVAAPSDDAFIDAGSVSKTITGFSGGNLENVITDSTPAVTAISDTIDSTTLSLTASGSVAEGGNIVYTASLTNPTDTAMTVTLSGGQTITIAAGTASGSVSVAAPSDDAFIDAGSVSKTITGFSGGNLENVITDSTPAVTAISDTIDSTTLSLTASGSVAEGGNIVYTASLTNPTDTAMTVTLSGGQTITIAAGTASGSVSVAAPSDDAFIDAGSVSKTITGFSGGNLENVITDSTPAVTAISDTIDSTTLSLTASGSVAEGGNIVYTASLTNPTDTAMTVTLSGGQTITIAAGTASGSVSVAAPSDDAFIDAGSVSKTITGFSGGNLENVITDSTPAVTAISDTIDSTTLSLTASGSVAEGGNIVYTASLTNPTDTAMTVTLSGGQTITIAAGTASGSVSVAAPSDDAFIDAGSVSKTITGFSGGNLENVITDSTPAVTAISDTIDSTTVSISGSASVAEGAAASYTVALTGTAQTDVTVNLTYSGIAADGSDYTGVASVVITAGSSSANFNIATLDDALAEGSENFTVSIASATGGNFEKLVVSPVNGSITSGIVDNDIATVSLSATPTLTEAGGNIVYTATMSQAPVTDLTVTLSNGSTITITAGQFTGTVSVPVTADEDVYIDPTSISATISSTSGGGISVAIDPTAATTSISDTIDSTTLSLTASGSVAEGGNIVYTASLTNPTDTAMTVTLSGGQTITIAAGTASGSVSVAAPSDDAFIDAGSVSKTITGFSGGNLENVITDSTPAVTAISDTIDSTTVSISGSASVAEGAAASYTVALTSTAQTDVTVNLTYSGIAADGSDYTGVASVVITAGTSSANFNIATLDDALAEGSENFTVSIASATGGNFEQLVVSPVNGSITSGIVDNDIATVSLSATPTLTEAGGNIVYTATMSQAPVTDLTVTLSNGSTITITAGQFTGTVSYLLLPMKMFLSIQPASARPSAASAVAALALLSILLLRSPASATPSTAPP